MNKIQVKAMSRNDLFDVATDRHYAVHSADQVAAAQNVIDMIDMNECDARNASNEQLGEWYASGCTQQASPVKFQQHCIVKGDRKVRVEYSLDNHIKHAKCVRIYAKSYCRELGAIFDNVQNNSDCQSDYHEQDRVTFVPGDQHYAAARAAAENAQAKNSARYEALAAKHAAKHAARASNFAADRAELQRSVPATFVAAAHERVTY